MFQKLIKSVFVAFLFVQAALVAAEGQEQPSSPMQTFIVQPQDLHVDQGNIFMDVEGNIYEVHSLRKDGAFWLAEAASSETCAWGHPLCGFCHMCHHRICPLYQARCSHSK